MKRKATILVMAALLAGTTVLQAQNRRFNRIDRTDRLDYYLDLTEEQEVKMDEMLKAHWDKMDVIQDEMLEMQLAHRKLMRKDELSQADLDKMTEDRLALMEKSEKERNSLHMSLRGILTEEQLEQYGDRFMYAGRGAGTGLGLHTRMGRGGFGRGNGAGMGAAYGRGYGAGMGTTYGRGAGYGYARDFDGDRDLPPRFNRQGRGNYSNYPLGRGYHR